MNILDFRFIVAIADFGWKDGVGWWETIDRPIFEQTGE